MTTQQQFTLVLTDHADGVQALALDDKDSEVASATGRSVAYAVMNLGVRLERLQPAGPEPEEDEDEPGAPDWDSLEQGAT